MPCNTFSNIKSPVEHACTACAFPIVISKMAKNKFHPNIPNTLRSSNPLSFMRIASFNLDQGSVGLLGSDPITRHVFVLQVLLANPYLSLLNMESQAGGQHLVANNSLFKSRSSLSNQIAWRLENSKFCKHPQKRYTLFWTVFVPHDSNNWNSSNFTSWTLYHGLQLHPKLPKDLELGLLRWLVLSLSVPPGS